MEERIFQTGDLITIFGSKTGKIMKQFDFIKDEGWVQVK